MNIQLGNQYNRLSLSIGTHSRLVVRVNAGGWFNIFFRSDLAYQRGHNWHIWRLWFERSWRNLLTRAIPAIIALLLRRPIPSRPWTKDVDIVEG